MCAWHRSSHSISLPLDGCWGRFYCLFSWYLVLDARMKRSKMMVWWCIIMIGHTIMKPWYVFSWKFQRLSHTEYVLCSSLIFHFDVGARKVNLPDDYCRLLTLDAKDYCSYCRGNMHWLSLLLVLLSLSLWGVITAASVWDISASKTSKIIARTQIFSGEHVTCGLMRVIWIWPFS